MKTDKEIIRIISTCIKGTVTEAERDILEAWLQEDPLNRKWFDAFTSKANLRNVLKEYDRYPTGEAWMKISARCRRTSGAAKPFFRISYAVAAVMLLAFGLGGMLWIVNRQVPVETAWLRTPEEHSQAVLVTSAGEEVSLAGIKDTCLVIDNHKQLWVTDQGRLEYKKEGRDDGAEQELHTLRIPVGGEYRLVLEDGTRIWLNSASELVYPAHFASGERKVSLLGEAYFEVARDTNRPFCVEVGDHRVKVLGTSFDITAYKEDAAIFTTLVEGSVEVDAEPGKRILKPGEQSVVSGSGMEVRQVDAVNYCSWINDRFIFMSEDLGTVSRKLSRWYGVEFEFADPALRNRCFSGSLPKYSDLLKILEKLGMTTDIRFSCKGNRIIVEKKTYYKPEY